MRTKIMLLIISSILFLRGIPLQTQEVSQYIAYPMRGNCQVIQSGGSDPCDIGLLNPTLGSIGKINAGYIDEISLQGSTTGQLIYRSRENARIGLADVNSRQILMTPFIAELLGPFSRDGSRFTYLTGTQGDNPQWHFVDLDRYQDSEFPFSVSTWAIAWSPTGKEIAFTDVNGHLAIFNVETEIVNVLSEVGAHPRWSPQGDKLLYSNDQGIYIYDMNHREAKRVSFLGDFYNWVLNESGIVYYLIENDMAQYWLYRLEDAQNILLLEKAASNRPIVAPDGNLFVILTRYVPAYLTICVFDLVSMAETCFPDAQVQSNGRVTWVAG